ncbi:MULTISPECIES: aldo/keto reductase [Viridibacillus]|uniref:Oxidoreductase yqkF n=1 Tax=Viridibacillus arenosi FSL R5-213 TaxID=1227360 RepID=W4EKX2_9BACL|nr:MULTISPECIES: aldo/keto reductase [Viridibacillus]ETT81233.1 oxidoreductase yqkF [Viridibacillus arenosi FSL R5-213]OMC84173.1 oxidoreductase [Viridibacillus sp. FSL H8-0123]OMC88694.1 oxidoreductase [Viridibacillus sp. FSL H7-0596]OMC93327.1 oxidoreductase [Viridibacillus arenosi]
MKSRKLGNSDLIISEIGLGCMSLPTDEKTAKWIVDSAVDHGITYFDTADLYDKGINEELVGKALNGKRQDIILATKVGNVWDKDGEGWHWDPSKKNIEHQVKESLRRLQTDYIDLYQLHGGTIGDPWDEITEAFDQLKKEGIIRAYGISSIRPNVIKEFLPKSDAVSVMMQYSLLDRRPEEWFDVLKVNNASIVTRGSLAKGLLTNEWSDRLAKLDGYQTYSQYELQATLEEVANNTKDVHAAALAYVLQSPIVASAVIGASSKEQLEATISAYNNAAPIYAKELEKLTKIDTYNAHR